MLKKAFLLLFFIGFSVSASAQTANWKNYTDMKNVTAAVKTGENIWAATTGGVFVYNTSTASYQKFHKVNGLYGASLTSAAVDNSGKIWFGSTSGAIDVYNPAENSFTPLLDIYNSLKQPKGINKIVVKGDSVFIASDFGISIVDPNTNIFIDTYTKFGNLSSNLRVNDIIIGDLVYAALETEIAVQKPGALNLSSPDSWNIFSLVYLNIARTINGIAEYDNKIIAATDHGLFYLEGNSFIPYLPELIGKRITALSKHDNALYFSSPTLMYKYNGQLTELRENFPAANQFFTVSGDEIYAATADGIIKFIPGQAAEVLKPDAPSSNLFPSLAVDNQGNLYSGSGRDRTGKGYYKLSKGMWLNYNVSTHPQIATDALFFVDTFGEEIYFGTWGAGFLKIKGDEYTSFNASNTPMSGITDGPNFIVVPGLAKDSRNNLWILNYGSVMKENLSLLTPDSTWYNFKIPAMSDQYVDENFGLVIDHNDTKWFFSKSTNRPGLYYFNELHTYTNFADDKSGLISEALNERVLSLAVDNRGDIWIGTGLGVNIITNPSAAISQNTQLRISSVFALRQQSINCIAVDPLNRKWIGTNQGLILVNSDGSTLIASFNTSNSGLLANEIISLAIDENSGIVYAGTDAGLTAFETDAKKPVESFTTLFLYPNPLKIGKGNDVTLTIDGLIKDSWIKILNVSGKLVYEFTNPSRVAKWDGRNFDGNYVSSGVYIIIASDEEGNNVTSAKVAVLRE